MNLKKFSTTRLDITLENVCFRIIDIDKGEFEESFPKHMHPFYELHYIIGGEGRLLLDRAEHALSDGDIFMTAPKVNHAQLTSPDNHMKEYHIAFEVSDNSKISSGIVFDIFNGIDFYIAKDRREVGRLFELLEAENDSKESGYLSAITSILSLILLNVFRSFIPKKVLFQDNNSAPDNRQLILDEAFLYSYKDLTLRSLASLLHLDIRQTQRIIKQKYGMNFVELRTHTRLSAAQNMIRMGNLSLSETAERCGFSNYAHFTSVFKKKFGVSPSEYKKMIIGGKHNEGIYKAD